MLNLYCTEDRCKYTLFALHSHSQVLQAPINCHRELGRFRIGHRQIGPRFQLGTTCLIPLAVCVARDWLLLLYQSTVNSKRWFLVFMSCLREAYFLGYSSSWHWLETLLQQRGQRAAGGQFDF